MKKMLKITSMILLAIVILIALVFVKAALTPAAPNNYTETIETGGEIERTYLKNGTHEVKYFEQKTDADYKKFEVYYPADLETGTQQYPVIVVLNGTGVKASKYKAQFRHYASWGFIVIGTEEEEAWDGIAAEDSLVYLLACQEDENSVLYQKIDQERIGVIGHSQGGAGVFNTLTEHEHSAMYKAAVSLSPTHEEQTLALQWYYDLAKINVPTLILAGTEGDFEMELVIPTEAMHEMYDKLQCPKAMARRKGCEHGEMLYSAEGYAAAWLMWQLQGDEEAAKAFTGDTPELLQNSLYQEQRIDLE